MGNVVRQEACPKCREAGKDSRGDNLYVYSDGGMYCHAGHGFIGKVGKQQETRVESKLTVADCATNPEGHDPARQVSESVWRMYDTRIAYDQEHGTLRRVYYPYMTEAGEVTGYKVRKVNGTGEKFFIVGKLQGLWGKQLTAKYPKGFLFITEGEEDTLALKDILSKTSLKDSDVVSVANGANADGSLDKNIQAELPFFQKYQGIVLCLDNDEPGQSTAKSLAEWLAGFVKCVKIVKLPMKDASDCLRAGKRHEVIEAIKNTPAYSPEGIIHGSEIKVSDLMRTIPNGFDTGYPGIDDKLHGIRKREILTVCAGSGIGKSTLVTEIGYRLVTQHGQKVCHIALENVVESTAASYVALDNNVPSALFRSNPGCIPLDAIEKSMDKTVRQMYFFSHFGSVDSNRLKNALLYYARMGVDFIILDHLSMVISGSDVQNERKEIDKIMTDLASMVVATGVGLINVVHLKRQATGNKDRGLNEGGSVSLTDLRGSAALEQLSWAVLAMERDQQAEDGTEDYAYLRVLKNRTWGRTGRAGRVRYDHSTGRLVPAPEEVENETPISLDTPPEEVASGKVLEFPK